MLNRAILSAAIVLFTSSVSGQIEAGDEVPDASGCTVCETRFNNWLTGKNINMTYWQQHQSAQTAADELCVEADDIFNNCFMVCIKDSFGNSVAHTEHLNAQHLEKFIRESCYNHGCRLADTLVCSRGAGRNSCSLESRSCYLSRLTSDGCTPVLPCEHAERQAFISTVRDSLDCFLRYPDLVSTKVAPEDDRRLGLQVCKDAILSGCLSDWSMDSNKQDFSNFVAFEDQFQSNICQREIGVATLDCIAGTMNGTVSYGGIEYDTPCNRQLMTEEAFEILQSSVRDIYLTYEFICSANASELCDRKALLLKGAQLSLNETDSNSTSSDYTVPDYTLPEAPPPLDNTDMAEGDENKPLAPEDDHTDHSGHDHHDNAHDHHDDAEQKANEHTDHGDHKHHETDHGKGDSAPPPDATPADSQGENHEGDKDHNHKHPGPIGKSSDPDNSSATISHVYLSGLVLLLLAAVCVQ